MRSSKIGAAANCISGALPRRSLAKPLTAAGRGAGGLSRRLLSLGEGR
jgi:hypothetical protein